MNIEILETKDFYQTADLACAAVISLFLPIEAIDKTNPYPELNTSINSLKTKLAKYYEIVIQPKLFKYELLK